MHSLLEYGGDMASHDISAGPGVTLLAPPLDVAPNL
jgi:hypothetical protein